MTQTSELAIAASDLAYTYAGRKRRAGRAALRGVSIEVPAGQSVALLGPNGSGKSTLLRLVCGMLPIQQGQVRLFGKPPGPAGRAELGVVFQTASLDRHLTVRENLRWQALLYGVPRAEASVRVERALERAGIADRARDLVKTLSHGLQRRVDLCRALLHRPRVLLLDEPTVGLDPAARASYLDALFAPQDQRGLTIVMSTHLVDEADRHDRVVFLHRGQIVADESPTELRRSAGRQVISVLDPAWEPPGDRGAWERVGGLHRLHGSASGADTSEIAAALARQGVPFSVAPPTLADVFERLTGTGLDEADGGPHAERGASRTQRKVAS